MAPGITETLARGEVDIRRIAHDQWLIRLFGEHDLATLDVVESSFDAVGQPFDLILVDLTYSEFVDATVVGAVLRHRLDGRQMALILPVSGPVRRLADVLQLETRIPVYWSIDDALNVGGGPPAIRIPVKDAPHHPRDH